MAVEDVDYALEEVDYGRRGRGTSWYATGTSPFTSSTTPQCTNVRREPAAQLRSVATCAPERTDLERFRGAGYVVLGALPPKRRGRRPTQTRQRPVTHFH